MTDQLIELWQSEWCPHSRRVRERLTELAIPFIARQVPVERCDRSELFELSGQRQIPVMRSGSEVVVGSDQIIRALEASVTEPAGAAAHRAKYEEKLAQTCSELRARNSDAAACTVAGAA